MRPNLQRWIADSDTRISIIDFRLQQQIPQLNYLDNRTLDLYYSLVGELFDMVRSDTADRDDWSALGRAFTSISRELRREGSRDAFFFGAVAYYCGGFPASATLTMRQIHSGDWDDEVQAVCYDLLARQANPSSKSVRDLVTNLRIGAVEAIDIAVVEAEEEARAALNDSPDEWVPRYLRATLLRRYQATNVRAVLPNGASSRWNPLVSSFLDRQQPVWDFFPSQIEAIDAGLLRSPDTYTLQMPTGAGKTALAETLLFSHLTDDSEAKSVFLVPYRALARELRQSLGRNLIRMGLPTRAVYGGTVPTPEEAEQLDSVRVIIATPEALMGLLGAHPEIASEISLVVCDEGHLLADETRGVSLELLLARLRARAIRPRTVFISAIVPNVEEINSWLGGNEQTVVRSTYRPAVAEYAILRPQGSGRARRVGLEFQALTASVGSHTLPGFLSLADFQYTNSSTGRINTFNYGSRKTQAIAAGRKALAMGPVAVFAATKTGNQGVIGLAEELLSQISSRLSLPEPNSYVRNSVAVADAAEYLAQEYGSGWTGCRALRAGVVVHHGDVPQETREVLEELLADRYVAMVLCTSTLAEGVNLPIRTLILYSVTRGSANGESTPMLARDIKNLVGRAGRAGSSTRGLVVCANEGQWRHIRPVAENAPGERVAGALIELIRRLQGALVSQPQELSNAAMEETPQLLSLVDGIDAALIELIHDEIGDGEFLGIATSVAAETFAARQADPSQRELMDSVFRMRATRLLSMRTSGRLSWAQATGGRPRLVDSIVEDLFPSYDGWLTVDSPTDPGLLDATLRWSLQQTGFADAVASAFSQTDVSEPQAALRALTVAWLEGRPYVEIAERVGLTVDQLLRIHTKVILFDYVTLVEHAIAIVGHYVLQQGITLPLAVTSFTDHLRYGVPTAAGRYLMARGVRHRRAAIELGARPELTNINDVTAPLEEIAAQLLQDGDTWRDRLGLLVYERTVADLRIVNTAS